MSDKQWVMIEDKPANAPNVNRGIVWAAVVIFMGGAAAAIAAAFLIGHDAGGGIMLLIGCVMVAFAAFLIGAFR